jgi:Bacterial protein of unknown function (HtrL_YibB)
MSTTLVTSLFDLKRGEMQTSFKRPFSLYLEHFGKLLRACKATPMLVYIDKELFDFVKDARVGAEEITDIRFKTADEFKNWFPFYKEVQQIRTDPKWLSRAGWLPDSTQAKLDLYNPLVMSKMFMLHDAMIFDPFGSTNYCWIDAGLTQTVHPGYFSNDHVIEKLEPLLKKFLFVCYPYTANNEIHGFAVQEMNRLAGTKVEWVARGGFFGGNKHVLREMNSAYYQLLQDSLSRGFMGTEESLFSILAHQMPSKINVEKINGDGLLGTFFERVKQMPIPDGFTITKPAIPDNVEYHQTQKEVELNESGIGTSLYVTTFNSPPQLQLLFDSFTESNPELFAVKKKYLIDNSIDETTRSKYDKIAKKYGFEVIREGNLGVCGARAWAAQHFHDSDSKYMVWFEDDMLLVKEPRLCRNGFNMHVDNWLDKCIKIVEQENLDFIKVSFSEFFGDHHKQWSWHNVPKDVREKYFPDGTCRMKWKESGGVDGLSYLVGEVFYSNWPSVMTRAGNWKLFLEVKYASPHEATLMSRSFSLMKEGRVRSAVLLASLIDHQRKHHYDKAIRKEC